MNEFYVVEKKEGMWVIFVDPLLLKDLSDVAGENLIQKIYSGSFNFYELIGKNCFKNLQIFMHKYNTQKDDNFGYKCSFSPEQFPHDYQEIVKLKYDKKDIYSVPFQQCQMTQDIYSNHKQ